MRFGNRQEGLGFTGWLLLILVFGGALTLGLKLVPIYMEHNTMAGVLDGIAAEPGMAQKKNDEIMSMVAKRFNLNNVRDFDLKENIVIKRDRSGAQIVLDYEVRMPFAYNVDMVASFRKEVELRD
ncbi:MAG: DUF4845 domain-containing protein [Pseudomonadales bacterium]